MTQKSIYRSSEGEAAIHALYDRQLAQLDITTESRMIPTRFGTTHVLVAGPQDGQPLVLLHGGNTTNPSTLGWLKPLTAKYRIFSPDTIGQPGKSAPVHVSPRDNSYGWWLADVLDGLGLAQTSLTGISYGAGILLRAAVCVPERIAKALLIVPSGIVSIPPRTMLFELVMLVAYRLAPKRKRIARIVEPMFVDEAIPNSILETTELVFQHVKIETEMPRNVTKEELAGFTAPTLVLAAEKDRLFPARQVITRAQQVFPNLVAAEIIPGSPHFVSPSYLPTLNRRIDEFLTETR
ncbi:MAG: alpha/beta hydrolase [Anaerolineae bacterium]|nr:alpha/beta hydrolase [Anaerolineae bacterium]